MLITDTETLTAKSYIFEFTNVKTYIFWKNTSSKILLQIDIFVTMVCEASYMRKKNKADFFLIIKDFEGVYLLNYILLLMRRNRKSKTNKYLVDTRQNLTVRQIYYKTNCRKIKIRAT